MMSFKAALLQKENKKYTDFLSTYFVLEKYTDNTEKDNYNIEWTFIANKPGNIKKFVNAYLGIEVEIKTNFTEMKLLSVKATDWQYKMTEKNNQISVEIFHKSCDKRLDRNVEYELTNVLPEILYAEDKGKFLTSEDMQTTIQLLEKAGFTMKN